MSRPHRLLAFDTAGSACSAALWRDGGIAAYCSEAMTRGHSERLLPMIEEVLKAAGTSFESLQGLAVTLGPGGFTGIRIGLATVRGLGLALNLPIFGQSSFAVHAAAVPPDLLGKGRLIVALDSRRKDIYLQVYDGPTRPAGEALAAAPETLNDLLPDGPLLLAGDAVDQARTVLAAGGRDLWDGGTAHCDVRVLARLAAEGPHSEWSRLAPKALYLRPPDVTRTGKAVLSSPASG